MDSEERFIAFLFVAFISFTLGSIVGCIDGRTHSYGDQPVITKVKAADSFQGKYEYTTTQFDFFSNELYSVGDTLKISKR